MELLLNEKYRGLSSNSKILYSLFLNRINFSKKNLRKFSDSNGIFIYYSISQMQYHLCCSNHTAINSINELEMAGLIRKEHQKNGMPVKIYVKDIRTENKTQCYPPRQTPQDKSLQATTNSSISKEKPHTSHSPEKEKQVSFDVEKAEKIANDGFLDFSNMKIKRRRKH